MNGTVTLVLLATLTCCTRVLILQYLRNTETVIESQHSSVLAQTPTGFSMMVSVCVLKAFMSPSNQLKGVLLEEFLDEYIFFEYKDRVSFD